jgi:hypothetical protein
MMRKKRNRKLDFKLIMGQIGDSPWIKAGSLSLSEDEASGRTKGISAIREKNQGS